VGETASPRWLPLGTGLPGWCDSLLAEPASPDFFASRLWYETLGAHAVPPDARPGLLCLAADAVALPLLDRRRALCSHYTLEWRPLWRPEASAEMLQVAGLGLGRHLRHAPPLLLEAMDPDLPETAALLSGAEAAGLQALRFLNFGNWHEALPEGLEWAAYLAARPPAMRSTIGRKLARAARAFRFELLAEPGPGLEAGIAAYEAVRAQSWKPAEPYPDFDRHLLRGTAAAGRLRLGVLRDVSSGEPVAAQYWVQGGGRAYLLKLCHTEASRAASPGTALTALMIRSLMENDLVRELDFGRGDDPYKQLWVSARRQRWGVLLASPWHPAGLLAIARHRAASWLRRARGAA
jgi:hypothetical protein